MDLGLKGRRALVMGGSRGLGKAVAEVLAEEGARVAICARDAGRVAARRRFATVDLILHRTGGRVAAN